MHARSESWSRNIALAFCVVTTIVTLGHATVQTTEIYVRADPTAKLEAIEAVLPPALRRGRFRAPDRLLASLKPSRKGR